MNTQLQIIIFDSNNTVEELQKAIAVIKTFVFNAS